MEDKPRNRPPRTREPNLCIRCREPLAAHFTVVSVGDPLDYIRICPSSTFKLMETEPEENPRK